MSPLAAGYDITVCTVARQENETKKRIAVLQRWSTKWGCYVDSAGSEMVDGDHVTIREHVHRPVDGQQPKDAVSYISLALPTLL